MNYLEIAKSCGADLVEPYTSVTSKREMLTITEQQLHAYTEQVCKQMVEALNAILEYDGTPTEEVIQLMVNYEKAIDLSNEALATHKQMMGDLYE